MIAIRFLELTKPIEAPTEVEGKEAVRFYCAMRGQILGYITLWNKGRPIGRTQLLQEVSHQFGQKIVAHLFEKRFGGEIEPWSNVERLVRVQLGLEPPQFELEEEEADPKLPNLTVSITVPSRDRPNDIRRCLESLTTHKSRFPFEIIVADNNPSSGLTEPVVRSFPGVTYLPEPRPGVTFARNAAALHAKGDIIVCTDDDVTYLDGWLDNLIAPYADPEVMAVSGMVIPYELEYEAQYWFEIYGALTRNFKWTRYDYQFYQNPPDMPMVPAWNVGVTANISFRAEIFADPEIGPFDDELRIAEDPYLIYRLIKANRVIIYEPKAVVQHRHRDTMKGLARQLYNYGRSSTGMQLRTYFVDGDIRGLKCLWDVFKYDRDRIMFLMRSQKGFRGALISLILKGWHPNFVGPLQGRTDYPLSLVLAESKGHLVGPFSLLKSIYQIKTKFGRYTPEQFALAQAARQRAKLAQAEQFEQWVSIKQLTEPVEERQLPKVEALNPIQLEEDN
jgi:glycosyltransferase involved in cell wall biosynthesis